MNDHLRRLVVAESLGAGRWAWWLAALLNGRLAGLGPIPPLSVVNDPRHASTPSHPRLESVGAYTPAAASAHLNRIAERSQLYGVHHDELPLYWLRLFGLTREDKEPRPVRPEVLDLIKDDRLIGAMLATPADWAAMYLGEHWYPKGNHAAWFPTPMSLAKISAAMTYGTAPPGEAMTETCLDPCCGTGVMLIAASDYCLGLYGQDIDGGMVAWCRFQLALYAPWAVFGSRSGVAELREQDRRDKADGDNPLAAASTIAPGREHAHPPSVGPVAPPNAPSPCPGPAPVPVVTSLPKRTGRATVRLGAKVGIVV